MTLPPLALTMGEPAGVGGDITLKAWLSRGPDPFFVVDDPDRLARLAKIMGLAVPLAKIGAPEEAPGVFDSALPVMPVGVNVDFIPGRPNSGNGRAVVASIEHAARLAMDRRVAAVVTNPIHKKSLQDGGFSFSGHTDFLGNLSGTEPVMMLACPTLRVVPVTIHQPLRAAVSGLTTAAIVHCGKVTAAALTTEFGIPRPRLAVAALNPHAGEGGNMGNEEDEVIRPAVRALEAFGIAVTGPAPADTLFHERARHLSDAVICMYHDQALIPLKTIDFDHGVNITLGLPYVRTAPDHGTAFDVAATGSARESSLLCAIATASRMARTRHAER